MKSFLFILCFLFMCHFCLSAIKNCNMTVEDADVCSRKLMFIGDRDNLIPANDDEMEGYCNRMKEGIRCIRHYARSCLPAFPQQVFGMFAYDAKSVLRKQCKSPKDRTEFMRHVACFLPKPSMEPLHLCMDGYILHLDIIKTMNQNDRIPGTCCAFHIFQDCIHRSTQSLCESKTGAETLDYIMNIINSMTDDVLDFTCGQYESIEACDKHMDPESWAKMKTDLSAEQLVAERAKQKFFSPIPSLVNVITNYEM